MMSLQMILIAHLMSYLHQEGGYSLTAAGKYLSLVLLGGMVGRIALAWLSDRYFAQKREHLLIIVMLATFVMVACMPVVLHAKSLMILFCCVMGFFRPWLVFLIYSECNGAVRSSICGAYCECRFNDQSILYCFGSVYLRFTRFHIFKSSDGIGYSSYDGYCGSVLFIENNQ
ncbi:hypothetical protein OL548_19055 [Lysinibacillus sp. MHQ-1]|nr:hypothetical protein OL548_19055 [Lysinibacillus sp. MHQ-1]